MPSLRHQFMAVVVPRVRRSSELDSREAERERLVRRHAALDDARLPTRLVPGLERRCSVVREEIGDRVRFPVWTITRRGGSPRRTLVWVPGGGFTEPLSPFHVRYAARLAAALDARLVLAPYPLTPEHTWRDSHAPLADLVARLAAEAPDGLVLGGDSAGGGLALALAGTLRDRGGPGPDRLLLLAPWVDLTASTPATPWFARRDPWLHLQKSYAYAEWWAGTPDDLGRPEVSPAVGDLAGLPPALLFAGTRDLLLPGCRLLARRAAEAGWDLTYVERDGLIHVYPLLPLIPEAAEAWRRTLEFLR